MGKGAGERANHRPVLIEKRRIDDMPIWLLVLIIVLVVLALGGVGFSRR